MKLLAGEKGGVPWLQAFSTCLQTGYPWNWHGRELHQAVAQNNPKPTLVFSVTINASVYSLDFFGRGYGFEVNDKGDAKKAQSFLLRFLARAPVVYSRNHAA